MKVVIFPSLVALKLNDRISLQKTDLALLKDFFAVLFVMLATVFAPPFIRMLGSRAWIHLGVTEGEWSILMAARGLVFIIFILIFGVVGDLFGRRRVFLLAVIAYILCIPVLMLNYRFSLPFFITFILWAILGVAIRTLGITLIILRFRGRNRVWAIAICSILLGLGFLLSPLLAQTASEWLGFNAQFIAPLLMVIAGFVMALKYIQESRADLDFWWLDAVAMAIWTFGLCLVIFAAVLSGSLGWTNPLVLFGLGIGALLLILMNWFSTHPISEKWRFKLRYGSQSGIAIFTGVILYLTLYAVTVQVFNFMSRVQNFPVVLSGIALAPIFIGALISLGVVRKVARWTASQAMTVGLVIMAIPALMLSLLQPDISYWVLMPNLLLLGFGFILSNSPRLLLLADSMPRSLAATAQSIGDATAHIGGALAYSFMITLLEGFGMRAYLQTLEAFGLSELQIAIRLTTLSRASDEISIVMPAEEQVEILQQIDYWIVQAYTIGLSRAMLVLALVCLFSAAIIYVGLKKSKRVEELEAENRS